MDEKILIIGLDGLERGFIHRHKMENTSNDSNTESDLISTTPPWTAPAWPSMMTGKNPGKHGVHDFFTFEENSERNLVSRKDVKAPYLWEVAEKEGLVPLVINFPLTHPIPDGFENGALVPGYLAPEDAEFHPTDLRSGFEENHGEYRIYPDYNAKDLVEEFSRVAESRRDMARFLDEQYDWDLLAVQFQVTDSIFHATDDEDEIGELLSNVDEYVGDILDLADEDTNVLIASDHGMGEYEWIFYVNSWLKEHGYCETETGQMKVLPDAKKDLAASEEREERGSRLAMAFELASRMGITPQRGHKFLHALGLDQMAKSVLPSNLLRAANSQKINFESSDAFYVQFNSLGIHINVDDDYESFRDELMEELRNIEDPEGKQVFETVKKREEVYEGSAVEDAPDIILIPTSFNYDLRGSFLSTFTREKHFNHKREGILITSGPAFEDQEIREARIYDVASTAGELLGLPNDTETDGTPLVHGRENPKRSWSELVDLTFGSQEDESSEVRNRLEDLGYLD